MPKVGIDIGFPVLNRRHLLVQERDPLIAARAGTSGCKKRNVR